MEVISRRWYYTRHRARQGARMTPQTHNFAAPTVPGTLRISVITDDETYVTDLPAAKLSDTLKAFRDFAGLDTGSASCAAVVEDAREVGDAYLIGVGALWLFLNMSEAETAGNGEMNRQRLNAIVSAGGCAMLTVTTETRSG